VAPYRGGIGMRVLVGEGQQCKRFVFLSGSGYHSPVKYASGVVVLAWPTGACPDCIRFTLEINAPGESALRIVGAFCVAIKGFLEYIVCGRMGVWAMAVLTAHRGRGAKVHEKALERQV